MFRWIGNSATIIKNVTYWEHSCCWLQFSSETQYLADGILWLMNKALKRKVNNISMPVEIHRNEWLMFFCIHLAIFRNAALLQKFVSRSEWHSKRAEINYKYCVALIFGCECWADCTQAAILHLPCLHFIATCELRAEGSTNTVLFFHTSCFVSALLSTPLWAAKHQIRSRAALLPLSLGSRIPTEAYMEVWPLDKPVLPEVLQEQLCVSAQW